MANWFTRLVNPWLDGRDPITKIPYTAVNAAAMQNVEDGLDMTNADVVALTLNSAGNGFVSATGQKRQFFICTPDPDDIAGASVVDFDVWIDFT